MGYRKDIKYKLDIVRIYRKCKNVLAKVSTKWQKMHYFRQFKDINSGWKHGYQTSDPVFSSNFYALFLTFISEFENT